MPSTTPVRAPLYLLASALLAVSLGLIAGATLLAQDGATAEQPAADPAPTPTDAPAPGAAEGADAAPEAPSDAATDDVPPVGDGATDGGGTTEPEAAAAAEEPLAHPAIGRSISFFSLQDPLDADDTTQSEDLRGQRYILLAIDSTADPSRATVRALINSLPSRATAYKLYVVVMDADRTDQGGLSPALAAREYEAQLKEMFPDEQLAGVHVMIPSDNQPLRLRLGAMLDAENRQPLRDLPTAMVVGPTQRIEAVLVGEPRAADLDLALPPREPVPTDDGQ